MLPPSSILLPEKDPVATLTALALNVCVHCAELVRPGSFVLVEGLFALYYKELLPLYQMSIYIDTPDEICFERRLKRDTIERGRTAESVCKQYEMTVRPSSIAYVRPSAAHADLVLDGTAALDWKVEQVLAAMRERGLLRLPR